MRKIFGPEEAVCLFGVPMDSPRHRIRCYDSCLVGIMYLRQNSRFFGLELITLQIVFVVHCVCELSMTITNLALTKSLTPECLRTLLAVIMFC